MDYKFENVFLLLHWNLVRKNKIGIIKIVKLYLNKMLFGCEKLFNSVVVSIERLMILWCI